MRRDFIWFNIMFCGCVAFLTSFKAYKYIIMLDLNASDYYGITFRFFFWRLILFLSPYCNCSSGRRFGSLLKSMIYKKRVVVGEIYLEAFSKRIDKNDCSTIDTETTKSFVDNSSHRVYCDISALSLIHRPTYTYWSFFGFEWKTWH